MLLVCVGVMGCLGLVPWLRVRLSVGMVSYCSHRAVMMRIMGLGMDALLRVKSRLRMPVWVSPVTAHRA